MERHALAILKVAESWNWPAPSCMEPPGHREKAYKFKAACRKFLSCLVIESHQLGGTLAEHFWNEVARCHPQMSENVKELRSTEYSSPCQSELVLFEGIELGTVNFAPVFELAADLYSHIGLAFMNSEDRQIWNIVSPPIGINATGYAQWHRSQMHEDLKLLALKRDGTSCLLTKEPFYGLNGVDPILMHVIPHSVSSRPDGLKCIALLGGQPARDAVVEFSNTVDNVLALEANAAASYRLCGWGIEACRDAGDLHVGEYPPAALHNSPFNRSQYRFRTFPSDYENRIGLIILRNGDDILFGRGSDDSFFHHGPHPTLCDLRLAVSRALHNSGAAEFISGLMEEADDTDCPHTVLNDKGFQNVLDAKLLISGRAQIV